MENLKKNREKIRTNEEQYSLKIMKMFRTASLGSNVTGSYKKKSVPQQEEGKQYNVIKEILYRSGDTTCFFIFRVKVLLLDPRQ